MTVTPVGRRFVFRMCGDCYSGLLELAVLAPLRPAATMV